MSDTRVNIQYSIDLDELPEEVERLLNKCFLQLRASNDLIAHVTDKSDLISVTTLEDVNELRMQLAKSDHILDDLTKIMSGYMRMSADAHTESKQQQEEETNIPTNPFAPTSAPNDSMVALEQKLKAFAGSMKNEQPTEVTDNE